MAIRRFRSGLTANATSAAYTTLAEESQNGLTYVGYSLSGTWNSATATVHICADTTDSPLTYVASALTATANVSGVWTLPAGCNFRIVVTGSGSPQSSLEYQITGQIGRA
jgi:hypothetical protein